MDKLVERLAQAFEGDGSSAKEHLKIALDIHQGHISGKIETTDKSQEELMMHMQKAYDKLTE